MIARNACALSVALATLVPLSPAAAQTDRGLAESDVIVGLGVGAGFHPEYEGAEDTTVSPLPALSIAWGDTLLIENGTLRVILSVTPWLQVGPLAAYRPGRQEDDSDSDRLDGLGDIDDSADVGGFARVKFGGWSAEISARQDALGEGGALVDLSTGYALPLSDSITVSANVNAVWASDDYMSANFGITRSQAESSDYDEFDAGAGFKNVGLSLGASYALSERWRLGARVGYSVLIGDAADSPIVTEGGSEGQFRGFLSVSYRFGLF